MAQASERFTAGPLTFVVKHELWDGNIHDHADQGVSIDVKADIVGKETALLRFNCFDFEKKLRLWAGQPRARGRRLGDAWRHRPNQPL